MRAYPVDQGLRARLARVERLLRPSPTIEVPDERLRLYAKLGCNSLIGSIKDRPAFEVLRCAILTGELSEGITVVESSSGNFALALAAFCRLLKLDFVPVIDPNISPWNEARLRLLCRTVVRVDECDETGGYLRCRLRKVQELLRTMGPAYWPNQYCNPVGMTAHYEHTAAEICSAVPSLDYAFIGVSSGGTIAGVSHRLKSHYPDIRVIAVDAVGSAVFASEPQRRYLSGLGSSVVPELVTHALIDEVMHVTEVESVEACQKLLQLGLFVGASSGSGYAAAQRYFAQARFDNKPNVLFLCCDHGIAYMDTVFDEEWYHWRLAQDEQQLAKAVNQ